MRSVADAADREGTRRVTSPHCQQPVLQRGLDPSIVSFAKCRTAAHWGLDEDRVDVLVANRLLQKAARLMLDLHDAVPDRTRSLSPLRGPRPRGPRTTARLS